MPRRVLVATGYIRDGKFRASRPDTFAAALRTMPNGPVVARIEEHKEPRSVALNAFWWGVLIDHISRETGMFDVEAHDEMKALHLSRPLAALRGNARIVGPRVARGTTTDLSHEEMWDLIERTYHWAATTLGLVLPYPNDGSVVAA